MERLGTRKKKSDPKKVLIIISDQVVHSKIQKIKSQRQTILTFRIDLIITFKTTVQVFKTRGGLLMIESKFLALKITVRVGC